MKPPKNVKNGYYFVAIIPKGQKAWEATLYKKTGRRKCVAVKEDGVVPYRLYRGWSRSGKNLEAIQVEAQELVNKLNAALERRLQHAKNETIYVT